MWFSVFQQPTSQFFNNNLQVNKHSAFNHLATTALLVGLGTFHSTQACSIKALETFIFSTPSNPVL